MPTLLVAAGIASVTMVAGTVGETCNLFQFDPEYWRNDSDVKAYLIFAGMPDATRNPKGQAGDGR